MTTITGMKASDLEEIFSAQVKAAREEKASFERTNSYVGVTCDRTLTRIPLDAMVISFLVTPSEVGGNRLHDDVMFSLILAQGSLNSVYLDVPFDSSVDIDEVLNTAESSGFGINLLPPTRPAVGSPELERYFQTLRSYGNTWLSSPQSNTRIAPIDGYIEYKLGVAAGYRPQTISTDEMMTGFYTDTLGPEAMDAVKVVLDQIILEKIGGDDAFAEMIETTAKAVVLKDRQYMEARGKILTEELDTRTPAPNLIRITSANTGLSIPDAAGLLYELKRSIHTVLDKYLPGQKQSDGTTKSEGQTKFAEMIAGLVVGASGGKDGFDALWGKVSAVAQVSHQRSIERGDVQPGVQALLAAQAVGAEPKVTALAIIEGLSLASALLAAGGAIAPPQPKDVKPEASGIIAVG
jgi:hypothetical protein